MITVYGTSNTRAFRVLWMLEELGVPDSSVASLLITARIEPARLLSHPQ